MPTDRVRPSRVRAEQDRALARYVHREVYAYSAFFRERLDGCGLGAKGVRRQEDLARLPVMGMAEVDSRAIVLRPGPDDVVGYGRSRAALEMRWARFTGSTERLGRATIEPDYKPVRWTVAGEVVMGAAPPDVDRLADLGRRVLELAGLRTNDVLVGVGGRPDELALWQLALGSRTGGVPSLFLGDGADPDAVARVHPTALTGPVQALVELLREVVIARLRLSELRTLIVTGDLDAPTRDELVALAAEAHGQGRAGTWPAADLAVVAAWAPAGARALWAECRGGRAFHTWPTTEVVQVVGREGEQTFAEGDLVWSALGWRGSVLLRLDAEVQGSLDLRACPTCGRTTPRVQVPAFG